MVSLKKTYISKKLGKFFNKKTTREKRVVVRILSPLFNEATTCVFFQGNKEYDIKRATIIDIESDLKDNILYLSTIIDCINYLLYIVGYNEIYLPIKYIEVCKIIPATLLTEVHHDYILIYNNCLFTPQKDV